MKRFTVLLMTIMLAIGAQTATPVYASSNGYARAVVKDAYFFSDKNLATSLFAVPYTYCIEVLRDDGDWYYARYASDTGIYKSLYGYCRKTDFKPVEGTPQVTYLYKTVTVTYSMGEPTGSLPVLSEIAVEAAFYGTFYSGATAYSYVYCQGSFGYIVGANDDYPLNAIESEAPPQEEPEQQKPAVNTALVTAIVISALAAAALAMLYFTSRKRGRTDA